MHKPKSITQKLAEILEDEGYKVFTPEQANSLKNVSSWFNETTTVRKRKSKKSKEAK